MKSNNVKELIFFDVLKEIISVFGETEVGTREVDVEAVAAYLSSNDGFKFAFDTFGCNTREDIEAYITDKILDGFPVWRYLNCSEWTKQMLEKEFAEECMREKERIEKAYKCFTCAHFNVQNTMLGPIYKCKKEREMNRYGMKRREGPFGPKKTCKDYVKEEM